MERFASGLICKADMPQPAKEEQTRRALPQGVAQRFGLRRALPQWKVQDGLLRITPREASGGREGIETLETLRQYVAQQA